MFFLFRIYTSNHKTYIEYIVPSLCEKMDFQDISHLETSYHEVRFLSMLSYILKKHSVKLMSSYICCMNRVYFNVYYLVKTHVPI